MGNYVPKGVYLSAMDRNVELTAERDKLVEALRSALVLAEIHSRPWDPRDSQELDRLCRILAGYG